MPTENYKYRKIISCICIVVLIFIMTIWVNQIIKPDNLGVDMINEKLDTNEYVELCFTGEFESGKGVICIAKSQFSEKLYEQFKESFPNGPLFSSENLDLIYFVKSNNKYNYRSAQNIPLQDLTTNPSDPIKINSSASYGGRNLYYIAFLGDEHKSIEVDGKVLYFETFDVNILGQKQTISIAYYISDKDEN